MAFKMSRLGTPIFICNVILGKLLKFQCPILLTYAVRLIIPNVQYHFEN